MDPSVSLFEEDLCILCGGSFQPFKPCLNLPEWAAARIKRWALLLAAYNYYKIEFIRGKKQCDANFLSRGPI